MFGVRPSLLPDILTMKGFHSGNDFQSSRTAHTSLGGAAISMAVKTAGMSLSRTLYSSPRLDRRLGGDFQKAVEVFWSVVHYSGGICPFICLCTRAKHLGETSNIIDGGTKVAELGLVLMMRKNIPERWNCEAAFHWSDGP